MAWKFFTKDGAEKRVPATTTTPSVAVYNTASISVPNNTNTLMLFDSEKHKTDAGMHSTGSNTSRLVCTVAGKYLVWANISWGGNASNARILLLYKNGASLTDWRMFPNTASDGASTSGSHILDLAVGDYLEVQAYQDSGVSLTGNMANANSGSFGMTKVDGSVVSYVGVPGSLVGQEVGFGQRTSGLASAGTTFAGGADVLATPISFTADGTTAYLFEVLGSSLYNSSANQSAYVSMNLDGADAGLLCTNQMLTAAVSESMCAKYRFVPSAGAHTVNARLFGSGGTSNIEAGAGGAGNRIPVQVRLTRAA